MKGTRLRITNLIKKIQETLPEGDDIYGFAGISKSIIIKSLNESHAILTTISNYPDAFETIFAKRDIADAIEQANNLINSIFDDESRNTIFNEFLRCVSRIKFIIKDAYISVSDNPLRSEQEIAKAKEELTELEAALSGITEIKESIDQIKNESTVFINDLKTRHETALANESKINQLVASASDLDKNLQGTAERIILWKSEIQTIKDDIILKQADVTKIKKEVEQTLEISQQTQERASELVDSLSDQIQLNSKHQEHIKKTIEDVSRLGMAGSFKMRKDELKWAQWSWAALTIISLLGLVGISYWMVKPLIIAEDTDITSLFLKIPMFASAVWLGWFCSRQYGFNTRIREDYAYKYAISMAFEGYKNETREISTDLLERLIELTILNAARSPERIYNSKTNHGSPYNEMIDNLITSFFGQKNKDERNTAE